MPRVEASWSPPPRLDEYELLEPLGRGAMGQVYLARDALLARLVAIKFIADVEPGAVARERFVVEARAIARLSHPNVVTIFRVGDLDGRPFIVSEYVRGQRLDLFPRDAAFEQKLAVAVGLARGLAAAHRAGVLHRDLKPENAILSEAGVVKILDFGLAKLLDAGTGVQESSEAPVVPRDGVVVSPAVGELDATYRTEGSESSADLASGADTLDQARTLPRTTPPGPRGQTSSELTAAGAILGTPLYMAPEIWEGEPATARSDVYSLGALLYRLFSGRAPHTADNLAQLGVKVVTTDAAPLADRGEDVDPRLCAIIDRCLRRSAADRFGSAEELRAALEELVVQPRPAAASGGSPYPGLRAFGPADRGVFRGRDAEVRAVLGRMRGERYFLLVGDSGAGKSSMCWAGVLPAIEEGGLDDGRRWTTTRITPGRNGLDELARALATVDGLGDEELAGRLRDDPGLVARALHRALSSTRGLAVLIDQLEELFTLGSPETAERLLAAVSVLTASVPGLRILATVRGDYLTALAASSPAGEDITRVMHLLRPMSRDALRDAIVAPALARGVAFESEALVDELVDAASGSAGALPLLQFTLAELWSSRDQRGRQITGAALQAIGGVAGALARHADGVLAAMIPPQRQAARRILCRLVTGEGTRAALLESELVIDDDGGPALRALIDGRLVAVRDTEAGQAYEIAHEALVARWDTLRGWLAGDAEIRAARERVRAAAREWRRLDHDREALWLRPQLRDAAMVPTEELTAEEQQFLAASRGRVRRARLVRVGLAAAAAVLVIGSWVAFEQQQRAETRARLSSLLHEARSALVEARTQRGGLERQREAALASMASAEPVWSAWHDVVEAYAELDRAFEAAARGAEMALMQAPEHAASRRLLAEILYDRAALSETFGDDARASELVRRMTLYDDGALVSRWRAPGEISISGDRPAAVTMVPYVLDADGRSVTGDPVFQESLPTRAELPAGAYLLSFDGGSGEPVRMPLLVRRGERRALTVALRPADATPDGFVYVPAGEFLYGTRAGEEIAAYLNTPPIHPSRTEGYYIAIHELTYEQYIPFLDALPGDERERRRPHAATIGLQGAVDLSRGADGWTLEIQPAGRRHRLTGEDALRYVERADGRAHRWWRLPVTGISYDDAEAFASWLDRTGRVPGARICREHEWERAARGADGRTYPTGAVLLPADANIAPRHDDPSKYGPDEVGATPASMSPFGLHDVAGNVFDMVMGTGGAPVARGGSFPFDASAARSDNREVMDRVVRDITVGVRLCADLPDER